MARRVFKVRPVVEIGANDEVIGYWDKVITAARLTGIPRSLIAMVVAGVAEKTKNRRFRYATPEEIKKTKRKKRTEKAIIKEINEIVIPVEIIPPVVEKDPYNAENLSPFQQRLAKAKEKKL